MTYCNQGIQHGKIHARVAYSHDCESHNLGNEADFVRFGVGHVASDRIRFALKRWRYTFSGNLMIRENMSTGTGKTKVVFFSTPISVNVWR